MRKKEPPPEAQLVLSLLDNGIDFIQKGIDELFGEDFRLEGALATEVDTRNYKYGIMSLYAGFLLLLKERLSRHLPELIFKGKFAEVKQKYKDGKEMPETVSLDEALERLEIAPRVVFLEDQLAVIHRVRDFRNKFEHYKVTENKYQLWAETTKFLDIIEVFLQNELGIDLDTYSKESRRLHSTTHVVRTKLEAYDSILEKEVLNILQLLAGNEVPGNLLNADQPVTLPVVQYHIPQHTLCNSQLSTYEYDIDGTSNGMSWAIEVKGGYSQFGTIRDLSRLLAIQQSGVDITWLIAFGEISSSAKEYAKLNNIYLTDNESWNELKRMVS